MNTPIPCPDLLAEADRAIVEEARAALAERREETARFARFVDDPRSGTYPNERLAIRVAQKNLALCERFFAMSMRDGAVR